MLEIKIVSLTLVTLFPEERERESKHSLGYNLQNKTGLKQIMIKTYSFFSFALLEIIRAPSPKIVINLPRTFKKLHYKGEPYRFSG